MRIAWIGSNSWQQLKSRETQSEGMKLDSISAISEVAKFYGTLDQVFRLLNRLNSTTRKIWNSVWAKLAEDIKRKRIKIDWENREMFVEVPIENKFVLSLFQPVDFDVETKASLKMLLELFENVENPQMLKMHMGISLSEERNTNLTLSNYAKFMKYTDFDYLKLYNKIIETAIRRQIHFEMMICFVFIHEIPSLKNIKFIRAIVFPWSKNSNPLSMINIWKEFWDTKTIQFEEVVLIWDNMRTDQFIQIVNTISESRIKFRIHANIEKVEVYKLFDQYSLNKNSDISMSLWDREEYIFWEDLRQTNRICLRKWFYQSSLLLKVKNKISSLYIKYQDDLSYNGATQLSISWDKILSIRFDYYSDAQSDQEFENWIHQINFDQKRIQFNKWIVEAANFKFNWNDHLKKENDKCLEIENNFKIRIKNYPRDHFINVEITNKELNKDDVQNLIHNVFNIVSIRNLFLIISDPSCVIDILTWWKQATSIKSVTLKITKSFELVQNHKIKILTNQLKWQGKKVSIHKTVKLLIKY